MQKRSNFVQKGVFFMDKQDKLDISHAGLNELITQEVNNLSSTVNEFLEIVDRSEEIKFLRTLSGLLNNSMREYLSSPDDAFKAINIAESIKLQLGIISKVTVSRQAGAQGRSKSLLKKLKSIIATLSKHLWQWLFLGVNLKSFTVLGKTNLNIFGFSGGVQIQITFGK